MTPLAAALRKPKRRRKPRKIERELEAAAAKWRDMKIEWSPAPEREPPSKVKE